MESSMVLRATKSSLVLDTSSNKLKWDKLEQLTLQDYRKDIKPSMLRPGPAMETITKLDFVGSTNFKNLKLLLIHCKQLSTLILSNVSLINYTAVPNGVDSKENMILIYSLTQISLNGVGPLTRDEQNLLGFFASNCNTPNLKIISFELKQNRGLAYTTLTSLTSADPESNALSEFLAKNSLSIKSLLLERTAVTVHSQNSSAAVTEGIRAMRLRELTCSLGTSGLEKILNYQHELEILNCYSNPYARISHFESVSDAIQRCAATLEAVRLCHKVIFNASDVNLANVPAAVTHNCRIYKDCTRLLHLSLSLSILSDPGRRRMKPGTIINLHLLPRSLKTLILRFDILAPEHSELFVRILPEFAQLGLFLAYGNPEMPFTVTADWIEALTHMGHMSSFEFTNCNIHDDGRVQELISSIPETVAHMEVRTDRITYRKNFATLYSL